MKYFHMEGFRLDFAKYFHMEVLFPD